MSNSCIRPIRKTLSSATTPGQSRPGSNGNDGVLSISRAWSLAIRWFNVISRTLVGGVLPLFRNAVYCPSRVACKCHNSMQILDMIFIKYFLWIFFLFIWSLQDFSFIYMGARDIIFILMVSTRFHFYSYGSRRDFIFIHMGSPKFHFYSYWSPRDFIDPETEGSKNDENHCYKQSTASVVE